MAHPVGRSPVPESRRDRANGPSFLDVLEEQLGLKMEARRAPVKVLVINHVERPAAN
jgi:uncharacterized protein (TIGR03435 family)